MKKIHFFAAIIPLLGCSHVSSNEQQTTTINDNNVKPIHFESDEPLNEFLVQQNLPVKDKPVEVISQIKMIDVPLINQNPELKYGCEVTSLTMVLNHAGVKTTKMELYKKVKKDNDPLQRSQRGDILKWGNPHDGFVGDMTGKNAGYAVFDKPIERLVNEYLP
jgi:uncharacterized protein YvpB